MSHPHVVCLWYLCRSASRSRGIAAARREEQTTKQQQTRQRLHLWRTCRHRELNAGSTFIRSASNNKLDTVTSKDHRWFRKIKALKSYVESNIWDSNGCAVIWQDHHGNGAKMVMLIHWLITRCHGQSANKILCNRNNKTRSLRGTCCFLRLKQQVLAPSKNYSRSRGFERGTLFSFCLKSAEEKMWQHSRWMPDPRVVFMKHPSCVFRVQVI